MRRPVIISIGRPSPAVKIRILPFPGRVNFPVQLLTILLVFFTSARAEWQRSETTLAWVDRSKIIWRFSFDPKSGKPFFDPVRVGDGPSFTSFKPEDHPWHYGLWFSWKYINHANYWEEDRQSGKAEGRTTWTKPAITTGPDGSAVIAIDVTYTHPSGRVDLTEHRVLTVGAPAKDGHYAIDWVARFVAGAEGALLDRTPMPGEPEGKFNGGYGGLGMRLPSPPLVMAVVTPYGPVTHFARDRARPSAPVVACNFSEGGNDLGGVAIFSDGAGGATDAPWYLVNGDTMRFVCAAILAPRPISLAPGAEMRLVYRIALQPTAWTENELTSLTPSRRFKK